MRIERLSIELSNRCAKACSFCYNSSQPEGSLAWQPDEVVRFVEDCANNGVRAVSFGGGEPLQYGSLSYVLRKLQGTVFRSVTTNGLILEKVIDELVEAQPDKIHISVHFPEDQDEVFRVVRQVHEIEDRGIRSGINLLVARTKLDSAIKAAHHIRECGIDNSRIVYLPMRINDTPTPEEMARVAGGSRFQSMSCLAKCMRSERFCSIAADKTAAWCSYTVARRPIAHLSYEGLLTALQDLDLIYCGGTIDHAIAN